MLVCGGVCAGDGGSGHAGVWVCVWGVVCVCAGAGGSGWRARQRRGESCFWSRKFRIPQ